jgi:hypothetical protein
MIIGAVASWRCSLPGLLTATAAEIASSPSMLIRSTLPSGRSCRRLMPGGIAGSRPRMESASICRRPNTALLSRTSASSWPRCA